LDEFHTAKDAIALRNVTSRRPVTFGLAVSSFRE
jgi:hypothetical protein